jgi:hypothetical protein
MLRLEVIENLSNTVAHVKSAVQLEDGQLCSVSPSSEGHAADPGSSTPTRTMRLNSLEDQRLQVDMLPDVARDQLDWLGTKSELDFWPTLPGHPLLNKSLHTVHSRRMTVGDFEMDFTHVP